MHFLTLTHPPYMRDQLGWLQKAPSVPTVGWPWGEGSFCDPQFPSQCSYGTTGPWGVQRETDRGWETGGILGDRGSTKLAEQINPGDYCQTARSSGLHMVKMGSGLTWTSFNWVRKRWRTVYEAATISVDSSGWILYIKVVIYCSTLCDSYVP